MKNRIVVSDIEIEIKRKKIKNMYLRVSGNDGRVCISAPLRTKDETIFKFATNKIDWIEKQIHKFESNQKQSALDYIDGETLYVWGEPYTLKINPADRAGVNTEGNVLILSVRKSSSHKECEKTLTDWYRKQLRDKFPYLFDKWESIIGVKAGEVVIRNMKSRWGSCNTGDGKITINLQLAKKPLICLEYVIVHELVHLLEPSHNAVFKGYMDRFLPDWRTIKKLSFK